MSNNDSMLKYHFMNTIERVAKSEAGAITSVVLLTAASAGFFITDAVNDYDTAMDNQGIEAVEQVALTDLSAQIVEFQEGAQRLEEIDQKLEYYDDLDKDERSQTIVDAEAALQKEMINLQTDMTKQVKEISVSALTSGNTDDGLAIGEENLRETWEQLEHTQPSLQTLKQSFDIPSFPSPSFAYLDEARADVQINKNAPLNVQYNAAESIASSSSSSAAGNGFGAFGLIALSCFLSIGGLMGVNANRKRQFGYGTRPKPDKPGKH